MSAVVAASVFAIIFALLALGAFILLVGTIGEQNWFNLNVSNRFIAQISIIGAGAAMAIGAIISSIIAASNAGGLLEASRAFARY